MNQSSMVWIRQCLSDFAGAVVLSTAVGCKAFVKLSDRSVFFPSGKFLLDSTVVIFA